MTDLNALAERLESHLPDTLDAMASILRGGDDMPEGEELECWARQLDQAAQALRGMGEALAHGTWAGDSDVLGYGWPVEVLASDPRPPEIINGHVIPRLRGRTACWVRCYGDGESSRDNPMYRSCDLCDLDVSDDDFDRLSALKGGGSE